MSVDEIVKFIDGDKKNDSKEAENEENKSNLACSKKKRRKGKKKKCDISTADTSTTPP